MVGLRKLKGHYYARVYIPRPGQRTKEKLISLRTNNKREASIRRVEVARHETELRAGIEFVFPWQNETAITEVVRYTLVEAVEHYLKARRGDGIRNSTLGIYRLALDRFKSAVGKRLPVDQIRLKHIEQFKATYIGDLATPTMNMSLRAIKTFLIWLKDNDRIKSVPKIKQINIGKPLPIYITDSEFAEILKRVDPHYQRVFHFYRETGCRLSEPFYGIINGDFLTIEADTAKSHQTRDIFLPPEIKQVLFELRDAVRDKVESGIANGNNAILFYSKVFHKACVEAEIEGKKLHSLRHTFAVRRYLQTRDIYKVAKELGHSSVKTTEIYTRFSIRRLEQDFPDLGTDYRTSQNQVKKHVSDTVLTETQQRVLA